jgi:dTDP-4-dehydrorhamnose 3,5-epimerase
LVLSEEAEFVYKCDEFYHPEDEGGLMWNDPAVGIEWPELVKNENGTYQMIDGAPLNLSAKDLLQPSLEEAFTF